MHTEFQIDHYIINKGNWTAYGRLKQARREIERRKRAGIELTEQMELLKIDRMQLFEKKHELKSYDQQRANIRITQMDRGIIELVDSIESNKKELGRFEHNQTECLAELGVEKFEDITPEQHRKWEEETWIVRIRAMMAMDFASEGRVLKNVWRVILSLPPRLKEPLVEEIFQVMRTLHAPTDVPDIPLLKWYAELPALESNDNA